MADGDAPSQVGGGSRLQGGGQDCAALWRREIPVTRKVGCELRKAGCELASIFSKFSEGTDFSLKKLEYNKLKP
jgi:hypothetical protein